MSSEEIFGAIAAGEMKRVHDLVAQDASCAGARNEQGISALMWALYNRRSDKADVVLDAASGVDVFEAAALGRTETISELIAEDATLVGAWSPDGFTALHLAAFFGHAEAVTLLLQQGAEASVAAKNPYMVHPLHSAAASGSTETVQALLKGGANVNAAPHGGGPRFRLPRSTTTSRWPASSLPPGLTLRGGPTMGKVRWIWQRRRDMMRWLRF